ncbi:hypothetical protein NN3_24740 [Nocardia neocaledoniensis NBRC 108232]|nr:hypothetical protein NN3_24740 [Nocardia neocaledoniensis NBRC 108232]
MGRRPAAGAAVAAGVAGVVGIATPAIPFRIRAGFRHTCGVAAIRISANFPANSGNGIDASSTSNSLTTPIRRKFFEIVREANLANKASRE